MVETPESVLLFWFGETSLHAEPDASHQQRWFGGGAEVDAEIRARFGETLAAAAQGVLDDWAQTPEGRLALVVVLDQLSRNIHRGSARAFSQDARALRLSLEALESGRDGQAYGFFQRLFLYTPLEHAEDLAMQQRCVVALARLSLSVEGGPLADWGRRALRFAVQHHDIVARFGRFPHRNVVLGRESTPEEIAWLAEGGERFGQ